MKRSSTSVIIREIKIKTTMRCHLTPVIIAIIKKTRNSKCWKWCGEKGTLEHSCWWEYKLVQLLWKTLWRFFKTLTTVHMCACASSVVSNSLQPPRLPGSSVHGIFWQACWSGLPFPPPGDISDPVDQTCVSCIACGLYRWATWDLLTTIQSSNSISIFIWRKWKQ